MLIAALTTGFFACKKEAAPTRTSLSESELALEVAAAAFPTGEENQAIADALLALLHEAALEQGEKLDALTALKAAGPSIAPALLSVKENAYSTDRFTAIRDALRIIAKAISPEVAGEVYYAAAKAYKSDLPYSLSDCRKVASFYFSQEESFNWALLEELRASEAAVDFTEMIEKAIENTEIMLVK